MSDIQNISITSTQTVQQPKPHTTYTISVSTPMRTWTVSRRYTDFTSLHAELVSSTGKEPPGTIPGKHLWSLTRAVYDEKVIRERRVLLEQYLRSILTTKDPRWRQSHGWSDFLAVPQIRSTTANSSSYENSTDLPAAPEIWTAQTWLTEQSSLSSSLRSVRAALLKRDALAGMSDAAGSRGAGVEAKRLLRDLGPRLEKLEKELKGGGQLGDGEKRRREEMIENLKAERANLGRMAEAGVRAGGGGSGFSSGSGSMPGGSSSLFAPQHAAPGRVFGSKAPQETEETRPLDDRGVLQLQQTKIGDQDAALGELSKLLQRQRKMGEEIHQEIGEQNELLEDLDASVDKTGGKLGRAKREMNKLK